jgi:hypothetical protein
MEESRNELRAQDSGMEVVSAAGFELEPFFAASEPRGEIPTERERPIERRMTGQKW